MARIPACHPLPDLSCSPSASALLSPVSFQFLLPFSSPFHSFLASYQSLPPLIICTLTKADPTKRPFPDWPRRWRAGRVCATVGPVHDLMFSGIALSNVKRCLGFGQLKTEGKQKEFSNFVLCSCWTSSPGHCPCYMGDLKMQLHPHTMVFLRPVLM